MQVYTGEPAPSATAPAQPSSSTAPTPSASASSATGNSMSSGNDAPELVSGGQLLVEAYAAIWLIVLGLVIVMWRRTRSLEGRLAVIDAAIAKAGGTKPPVKAVAAKKVAETVPAGPVDESASDD